jgi:hypothetical protein
MHAACISGGPAKRSAAGLQTNLSIHPTYSYKLVNRIHTTFNATVVHVKDPAMLNAFSSEVMLQFTPFSIETEPLHTCF